jgi:hypothetical protein
LLISAGEPYWRAREGGAGSYVAAAESWRGPRARVFSSTPPSLKVVSDWTDPFESDRGYVLRIERQTLKENGAIRRCDLLIIDLGKGDVVQWFWLMGEITELFDVAIIPSIRRPSGIRPNSPALGKAMRGRERVQRRLVLGLICGRLPRQIVVKLGGARFCDDNPQEDRKKVNSLRETISRTSRGLKLIGLCLPFVVVIAFICHVPALLLVNPILFGSTPVSHLGILRDQYAFLSRTALDIVDEGDFHLFELFIGIASVVGIVRILTGASSRSELAQSRGNFRSALKRRGTSTLSFLSIILLFSSFLIFCSLDFQFASHSDQALLVVRRWPHAFVCLEVFLFCIGIFFLAEGLLTLLSLIVIRSPPERDERQL